MNSILDLSQVLINMLIFLTLIALGYRISFSSNVSHDLAKLIVNVTFPFFIFYNFFSQVNAEILLKENSVFFLGMISCVCGLLLSRLCAWVLDFPPGRVLEFVFVGGIGNTGFLGIPFCTALFGLDGGSYAILFDLGHSLFFWSFGIAVLKRYSLPKGPKKPWNVNIPVLSYLLSIGLIFMRLDMPRLLLQGINMIGALTVPLSMLFIGTTIKSYSLKTIFSQKHLPMVGVIKLILLPLFIIVITLFFNLPYIMRGVTIVQAAMPTLAMAPIVFQRYHRDVFFGSSSVFVVTILGFFTVLMLYFVFNYLPL